MAEIMKTVVVTDSCSDLDENLMEKYNIHTVPLRMVFHNGEYRDRIDISADEVYERMKTEVPKTSLPVQEDVLSLYDSLADEGYTDVIHVTISSGLSGTYNMIRLIAESYTRMNITVVDSKTLSMHQGYMAMECAKVLEQGGCIEKAKARMAEVREKGLTAFVIPTLEYLRKGGRIGLVEGTLGTLLRLKPVIYVNDSGVYQTLVKHPNFSYVIEAMVKEFTVRFGKKQLNLSVMHGAVPAEAEKLLEKLKKALNITESKIVQVTPVLGVHTGPGLLGVTAYEY